MTPRCQRACLVVGLVVGLGAGACARNSATGGRTGRLISTEVERELGSSADDTLLRQVGTLSEPAELKLFLRQVGGAIAVQTGRNGLDWQFRILDDPAVNAFSAPGGYVYVTRGMLAHLNSTSELAAVVAHECGHIAARHAAVNLRMQQKADFRVALVQHTFDPLRRHAAATAETNARAQLLVHRRESEVEADRLGVRYVAGTGYDASAFLGVMEVLASTDPGVGKLPAWARTHPLPQVRRAEMVAALDELGLAAVEAASTEPEFLDRLDGLPYGTDPRRGYIAGGWYVSARLGLALEFPGQWQTAGGDWGASALSPDGLAHFGFAPRYYEYTSAERATNAFFVTGHFMRGDTLRYDVSGWSMHVTSWSSVSVLAGRFDGLVAFVELPGAVGVLLSFAPAAHWPAYQDAVFASFKSLHRLSAEELEKIVPAQLRVVTIDAPTTIRQWVAGHPQAVDLDELQRLNRIDDEEILVVGQRLKTVPALGEPAEATTASPPEADASPEAASREATASPPDAAVPGAPAAGSAGGDGVHHADDGDGTGDEGHEQEHGARGAARTREEG